MKTLTKGQALFTKDGRNIGNAVVTGQSQEGDEFYCHIKTDFGSEACLPRSIIEEWFYLEARDGSSRVKAIQ